MSKHSPEKKFNRRNSVAWRVSRNWNIQEHLTLEGNNVTIVVSDRYASTIVQLTIPTMLFVIWLNYFRNLQPRVLQIPFISRPLIDLNENG